MTTGSWDEFRTAFHVDRNGTVSGAAEALGVHHATVIRHVDALEARLGVKLFQRHARGYTTTDAGAEILQVGAATEDQLNQLVSRIRGQAGGVEGELIVTTVAGLSDLLVPVLADFQAAHPAVQLTYLTDSRLFRLEYGEAHVAIRAGEKPQQPDNVVQPFGSICPALCASPRYRGFDSLPAAVTELADHKFVGMVAEFSRAPSMRWLDAHVPAENFTFRATESRAAEMATCAGIGIGFVSQATRPRHPDLVQIMEPLPQWAAPLWLVTHVDLHRTPKVQALLSFLKERIGG